MVLHDVWHLEFDLLPQKPISVEPVCEDISTDGGLLNVRQWDEQQGFTANFANLIVDPRTAPDHTTCWGQGGALDLI